MANCGSGTIATDSESYQLAKGYMEVYDAWVDRNLKKDLHETAVENEFSADTIAARKKDYDDAQAHLTAVSMGTIYQAGIAEWEAKGVVDRAISEWDKVIGRRVHYLARRKYREGFSVPQGATGRNGILDSVDGNE